MRIISFSHPSFAVLLSSPFYKFIQFGEMGATYIYADATSIITTQDYKITKVHEKKRAHKK